MGDWWQRDIVEPGKLGLLLCFAAFVVTFLTTRAIRAGRGPFHDNVSSGGTHVHHAVPGIVAIGVGTSLVLDEFALILHLQDVYWADEGRVSVEMVSLAFGCLGFTLVGFAPFGVDGMGGTEIGVRVGALTASAVTLSFVVVCVLKGKFRFALFGIFLPPLAWVGAVRLARPRSRWARHRYGPEREAHAARRATEFDARWDPVLDRISDLIAGKPTGER